MLKEKKALVFLPPPLPKESKILLVDYSAMIIRALKRFLAGLGYENVIKADDGSTAVEDVKNESPDFLFMDVVMTKMNGNDALKIIRENGSEVPIVMLSSVTDKGLVDECQQSGQPV
jgi:CheY-like chemotaxis protein